MDVLTLILLHKDLYTSSLYSVCKNSSVGLLAVHLRQVVSLLCLTQLDEQRDKETSDGSTRLSTTIQLPLLMLPREVHRVVVLLRTDSQQRQAGMLPLASEPLSSAISGPSMLSEQLKVKDQSMPCRRTSM